MTPNQRHLELMKRIENDLEMERALAQRELKIAHREHNVEKMAICSSYAMGIQRIQEVINALFKELRVE